MAKTVGNGIDKDKALAQVLADIESNLVRVRL